MMKHISEFLPKEKKEECTDHKYEPHTISKNGRVLVYQCVYCEMKIWEKLEYIYP